MIDLVEGEGLGAGKSYYVTLRIARHIAAGGTVFVTDDYGVLFEPFIGPMPYKRPRGLWQKMVEAVRGPRGEMRPMGMRRYVERIYGVVPVDHQIRVIPAADVWRLHECTPPGTSDCPVLIVIDEAQGGLNTRDTRDDKKRPLFDWCCQSRHDDNDLIFLTQKVENIDVMLRRLASQVVIVKNMARDGGFPVIGEIPCFFWRFKTADGRRQFDWKVVVHSSWAFGAYISKACAGKHKRGLDAIPRVKLEKVKQETSSTWQWAAAAALGVLAYIVTVC